MLAVLLSLLLAALIAFAAVRKLSHRPDAVASYARVGVPEERLDVLAALLLAGAAGLIAGLAWPPLGIAAAAALVAYFAVAIAAHFRSGDVAHVGTPIAIELLAIAALLATAAA